MEKSRTKKIAVILLVIGTVIAYKTLHFENYLSLSFIKDSREQFAALYREHNLLLPSLYMLIYILVTSLSLPGAAVMTLAGGALFGLSVGTVIVSFASSIGATVACVAARFLLRDWVQEKFGDRLATFNEGIEKEGAFYLFTLRLIPVFPFFMINLVMGLTRMTLFRFYWVSQLGMLPGTIVYVNAGRELAKIESLSGILSPGLIISFALIGLFPLIIKKSLNFYRSRTRQ